jgi:PAS domain S-box-containing protein
MSHPGSDSEELLRSIVESAVDGIVVIDARGVVEAFNQRRGGFVRVRQE